MSQRIEDYALIGDLHTAALVGMDGSVDWLCLPHFDSPSCFSRLLGEDHHGFWRLAPAGGAKDIVATRRWYRPDTLVLETEFDTPTGTVRITDCMPVRDDHPHLVRTIEGVSGSVDMRMDLVVRFDYGEVVPWVTTHDGLTRLTAGPDSLALWHRVDVVGKDLSSIADFTVTEGQRYPFTLVWYPSHEEPPPPLDSYYAVHLTEAYWTEWAALCCYTGAVPRRGGALAHHAQGADLRADRWHRRRTDHVAPRGARRQPQLGLPLLLAARRHAHPRVAHAGRLLQRGHGLARLVACGRWPATSPSCRSCTARPASAGWTSGRPTGCPATRTRRPCGSATPPRSSTSSTSTARSCRRSTRRPTPRACTAGRPGTSRSS